MAWNKARPDLLAVGYGSLDFSKEAAASSVSSAGVAGGLVAFWSLKNPEFPLWWVPWEEGALMGALACFMHLQ